MNPYQSELLMTTARVLRELLTYFAAHGENWPSRHEAKSLLIELDEVLEPFEIPRPPK